MDEIKQQLRDLIAEGDSNKFVAEQLKELGFNVSKELEIIAFWDKKDMELTEAKEVYSDAENAQFNLEMYGSGKNTPDNMSVTAVLLRMVNSIESKKVTGFAEHLKESGATIEHLTSSLELSFHEPIEVMVTQGKDNSGASIVRFPNGRKASLYYFQYH